MLPYNYLIKTTNKLHIKERMNFGGGGVGGEGLMPASSGSGGPGAGHVLKNGIGCRGDIITGEEFLSHAQLHRTVVGQQ